MMTKNFMLKTVPLMGFALLCGTAYASPEAGVDEVAIVQQQTITVKGTVKDANGEPLIGVNVLEAGTTNGTVTDFDGNYTLNVKPNATLQISYVGYSSQSIAVAGKRQIDVTLKEDSQTMDELVVVGYGVVRKADLAGSVSVLDNKSFKEQPITQVSEALNGRVAGVTVQSDGVPGGTVKIRVRGANSVTQSNDPLYVVDGIVRESGLAGLNPEDIQSMQVLKDASSTAIYGARGSNGVVIVTTKKGRAGNKQITLDAAWGVSSNTKRFDKMDAKMFNEAWTQTGHTALQYDGNGIDWQDMMFRSALTQNYKVAFSNGTEDTQYYVSGNYTDNQGVVINTGNKRYQVKANINSQLTKWLTMTADVNAAHNDRKYVNVGGKSNVLWQTLLYSPAMNMMNGSKYAYDPANVANGNNPYGEAMEQPSEASFDVFNGRIDLKFDIMPGLTFTTTNGIDFYESHSYGFKTLKVERSKNSMENNESTRTMLQSTNNLTYLGNWGDHHLTATGVFEVTTNTYKTMGISGENLLTESVGWWNVGMANNRSEKNSYQHWALMSGVGRVIYNYANRYMFTGTLRADGSSRFSKKKWGYFPSAAFAWTLSNEKFMENVKSVENVKLRASWGLVGNQNITPYQTLGLMGTANFDFTTGTNMTGYWSNSMATPNVTWEKTKQWDLGVEFTTLGGKLDVTFDYFQKRTYDALLARTTTRYLGETSYMSNDGEVTNKGFDFTINYRAIQGKDFSWTTSLNGSHVANKVEKLVDFIQVQTPASGTIDYAQVVMEGYPLGTFWGYTWTGLDSTGHDTYAKDGDGNLLRGDLGTSSPKFTAGWNNQLTYKNWDLNIFFNSSFGAKRLNFIRCIGGNAMGDTMFIILKEAWTQNADKGGSFWPSLNGANDTKLVSSKWIEDASYVRLENISLSYNLSKKVTKFADVRLSLSCQNLFTITGYKGMDPAGTSFYGGNVDQSAGIDMGAYPTPRTITFGARFNF